MVLGWSGRVFQHDYTLRNDGIATIKILKVVNAKTCCGEVEVVGPTSLEPGQNAKVRVSLKVGGKLGPVSHLAVLETDVEGMQSVEYRTLANVKPRLKIEEVAEGGATASSRQLFKVTACGTPNEPPIPLEPCQLKSATAGCRWESEPAETRQEGGIVEFSRGFSVDTDRHGGPAFRSAEVSVNSPDGGELISHTVRWEVPALLASSPSALLLNSSPSPVERQLVIRSTDRKPFSIRKIEGGDAVRSDAPVDSAQKTTHILRFRIEPSRSDAVNSIVIVTDHPDQTELKVPVVLTR